MRSVSLADVHYHPIHTSRGSHPNCGIIECMMALHMANPEPNPQSSGMYMLEEQEPGHPLLRVLSLASILIGATALGLYLGRELRQRYKFKRRTPYDFYSKAGDPVALSEYGMGV